MTLPKLLAKRAAEMKNEVALRQKHLGIWNEVSWGEYQKNVEMLAIALSTEFKFKRGETLALIGENRPHWLYSQMAAQALGGVSAGIYQDSLPAQLIYYLNDCQARIAIVEDQEQVDKLLEIKNDLPYLEHIIFCNGQGLRHYKHDWLTGFDALLEKGAVFVQETPAFYSSELEFSEIEDTAIIAYSASATGHPKGVKLSHSNLIAAAQNLDSVDKMKEKDDYFSFLPLSWIHEQVISIVVPLLTGMAVNFPEKPHTVLTDLREIGPQTLLAPPRVYQTLLSNFTIRIQGSSWLKKKVYLTFKKYGDKVIKAKLQHQKVSAADKLMYGIGDWLVFSAIRDHMGFGRVKRAYIAGATLEPETYCFFHSIGVNVKQTYGATELAGIAFVQRDEDLQLNSVGKPLPHTEMKVSEKGDIFVRNAEAFAKSESSMQQDGWISLGDCGRLDDSGHLYVLDRKEDIITLANGELVYPSMVENKLKASPYIQEAVCFGEGKPYITAILNIDLNSVGKWADKNRLVYTDYSDLAQNPEVIEFISKEVSELGKELEGGAAVKKFAILHKQLSANDDEMTRTLKIRRNYIKQKYGSLIESFYGDSVEAGTGKNTSEDDSSLTGTIRHQVVQ
ncbi:AMP-binding protein [Planococcus shenhongbingii]|uniref:AMP-dependent synthetase/ligase n=1 Tax=Planococcus shenhongbingii TaxID=3058398 RepID=UPI002612E165|nr:AMP-binding protein [Planococcus sp. N016]WKA59151.1 AMP-binding protein [Planococcus sp. N016]